MDNQGWIKLHRKLMDKAIWLDSTPEQKVILITLLSMANHTEKEWEWKGQKYIAKPGQFVTSLSSIKEKCGKGISIQNIRTALKRFENYGFLTNETTSVNRLITIVNWEIYQKPDDDINNETNKALTKSQQSTNKVLTTNKNDKNDKNDKKMIQEKFITRFNMLTNENIKVTPSINQLFNLLLEEFTESDFDKAINEINKSTFLKSNGNLYRLLRPDTFRKLISGSYRDYKKPEANKTKFHNFKGHTDSMSEEDINKKTRELMRSRVKI